MRPAAAPPPKRSPSSTGTHEVPTRWPPAWLSTTAGGPNPTRRTGATARALASSATPRWSRSAPACASLFTSRALATRGRTTAHRWPRRRASRSGASRGADRLGTAFRPAETPPLLVAANFPRSVLTVVMHAWLPWIAGFTVLVILPIALRRSEEHTSELQSLRHL